MADEYGYLDIDRIRADAGSEFTSGSFKDFCMEHNINLSLVAPKRLDNNHLAERSWQTIHKIAHSMLVHARLPDKYHYQSKTTGIHYGGTYVPHSGTLTLLPPRILPEF